MNGLSRSLHTISRLLAVATLACSLSARTWADAGSEECAKSAMFLAPGDRANSPKYAPDREVQMLHLALDVTPDFRHRTIVAQAVLRFKAVAKPVREVKFDAVELNVHSVTSTEKIQAWQAKGAQVSQTVGQLLKTLAK